MAYQLTQDCIDMVVEMSASAHSVLVVLCRHANDAGECFPSTALIAKKAHLNPRTVMQAVKELEQCAWISSTQVPGKRRRFLIDGAKIQSFVPSEGNSTPAGNCTRIEHIKEQEKDREENAPASNPESGTCDVTASDLCPSVDAFALSSETPKAAEKPKKGKKAKEPATSIQKPEGVPQEDWDAYKKLRKDKRMPLTQRALEKLQREADKAGKTLAEVIVICLENSWASFGADWKVPGQTANNECTGLIPDRSRNQFYFPDGGRPNRKTTEVPEDYDATAEASDLVGRMLG